jgi:GMP reductase
MKTGFGTGGWQLSALKWCARVATKPIIADGGIREHGDIAKSVRFGATMVMVGSLLAGHEESPGQTVDVDGKLYKEYYGSASDFNKGEYKHVEGKRILEPVKGKLPDTLREMEEDIQSSISYAGGKKLMDIRKVNYVILGGDNAGEHLLSSWRSRLRSSRNDNGHALMPWRRCRTLWAGHSPARRALLNDTQTRNPLRTSFCPHAWRSAAVG